jgi:uncharacterized membrane protein (DUF4010 family)
MNKLIEFYKSHGTKILGSLLSATATTQAILAAVTSMPEFTLLVTPKQFATLSVVNVALGVFTIKRGFTNTKNAPPSDKPPGDTPK